MALQVRNITATTSNVVGIMTRFVPKLVRTMTFAAGSGTLAPLTPVAKNNSTGYYVKWTKPTQKVSTISVTTAYTGGNFTITVDEETTANIAHSASAADVLAAINLLSNVESGDFTVTEPAAGGVDADEGGFVISATSTGRFRGRAIAIAITSALTGGTGVAIAETTAGVAANGTDIPQGFVYPNDIVLSGDGQVQGVVALECEIHVDDVAGVAAGDLTDFKWAAGKYLRNKNIIVDGIVNII